MRCIDLGADLKISMAVVCFRILWKFCGAKSGGNEDQTLLKYIIFEGL